MRSSIYFAFALICLSLLASAENAKDKKKPVVVKEKPESGKPKAGEKSNSGKKPSQSTKAKEAKEKRMKELAKRRNKAKEDFKKRRVAGQVDKDVGNSILRVDKKGAKIEMLREGQVFEMKLKHIYEKVINKTKRNEYNLKKTDFTVNTKFDNSTYGVNAGVVTLSGKLDNYATLKFNLYMFAKSANITGEDGNEYELVKGAVKMNLEIDWPYKTEHLEVKIAVKCGFDGKKGRKPKISNNIRGKKGKDNARGPKTYTVCSNARMTFSPSYKSNGTKKDMPANYPMPSTQLSSDGESEVTLKFNGVWKNMFYDPVAEVGDDVGMDPLAGDDDDSSSAGIVHATPNNLMTFLVAIIFSVFKFVL